MKELIQLIEIANGMEIIWLTHQLQSLFQKKKSKS
jgi:hypothetical protein